MAAVAVMVTLLPVQTDDVGVLMLIAGTSTGLTVIVRVLDVAVADVTHNSEEVSTQLITSF